MPSSFTSFQDGDPSSPEHFNAKFGPIVDATVNVTGIEVLSDGSSLGTATKLNIVGSSSVSSQAAGQISIAIPQITGTGTQYARFNSGGTFLESAQLSDRSGMVSVNTFASVMSWNMGRRNGSSSATTAVASNQTLAAIVGYGHTLFGTDVPAGAIAIQSTTVSGLNPTVGGRILFSLDSRLVEVMEILEDSVGPTPGKNRTITSGRDGAIWESVQAVTFGAQTQNSVTLQILTATLGGSFPNGGDLWTVYNSLHAGAQSLRLGPQGQENSGIMYIISVGNTEAYFSALTREVMRIGSNTTRFHSVNAQGMSLRGFNTISSYSATTTDRTISVDSSSNLTVTLPAPSTVSGHFYTVKRAGAGTLEVNASSGASIDNLSVYTLASQWSSVNVQSVGTRYLVL